MRKVIILIVCILIYCCSFAQYTANGSAFSNNCHCYTITPDVNTQSGSVWNNIRINLQQSFDYNFDIYLGCTDDMGADGIVFVMQPISTSVGSTGGGMGFEGISPSLGVTIDTWQNQEVNDPAFDHISIQLNGIINHSDASANAAGPVTALDGQTNIEDCQWHTLRIVWDANGKKLTVYVDGNERLSLVKDLVNDLFGGNPLVFWGFTGGTGGARNLQQFCTALSPLYKSLLGQKRCVNSPISFFDSTISFAPVIKTYWDFGDGSPIDSVNRNPVHVYTSAGDYTVIQTVQGADGCVETKPTQIRIGSIPVAGLTVSDSCIMTTTKFSDMSTVAVGNINNWYWDFGNDSISSLPFDTTVYTTGGLKTVKHVVQTEEGCISDTLVKPIYIFNRPAIDFTFTDSVCLGSPMFFSGTALPAVDTVRLWGWLFENINAPVLSQSSSHIFNSAGNHDVVFFASHAGYAGCATSIQKPVFVRTKPVGAFTNNNICAGLSTNLSDSSFSPDSAAITAWWWDLGNGQTSNIKNPQVLYNSTDTVTIRLVVQTGSCVSDTISKSLIVYPVPVADFDYNGKLCEEMELQFSDSSKVQSGAIAQWLWLYQNAEWSSLQNPVKKFAAGNQSVGLSVLSDKGCKSDAVNKSFYITPKPLFNTVFSDGCKDAVLNFTATDLSGSIQSWQWSFGDGAIASSKDTQHVYSSGGTYQLVLSVMASTGCEATDSSDIIIYATNASTGSGVIIAAAEEPVQLNATGGINYEWSPADGLSNAAIENPIAINTEDQQYILRVYTPQGCDSYDTVVIKIYDGPDIYVPTAFYPASTVGNHIFKPIPVGITKFKYFTVYNRYGQVVYTSNSPLPGWDGTLKGQPQPAGAYVWVVAGTSFRGREIIKKGTVVLLR